MYYPKPKFEYLYTSLQTWKNLFSDGGEPMV